MRSVLASITDVRPGEWALVGKTTAILFCVIAGHTLTETARDALFFGELPPSRLAVVYGVLGLTAIVASRFQSSLLLRLGRRSGLQATLMLAAYGSALFYLLPSSELSIFCLYVFSGLVSSVAVVQFWTLASHWLTVSQGRRLFGLISAGGVLGALTGAGLAIGVLRVLPVTTLLLLAVGAYQVAAFVVSGVEIEDEPLPARDARASAAGSAARAWLVTKRAPYVRRLAGLLAVSTVVLLIADYLFKSVAARAFAADELPGFFATYYAGLNGLALLVQLALSTVVVQRLGVLNGFLVLPLLLTGGAALVLASGGVAAVLLTKALDGSLRHSLHRVTSELLWMPLSDEEREATKPFVETFVVRLTQALVGAGLWLLADAAWDEPITLAAVMLLACGVWLVLGTAIRRPYVALFRSSLVSRKNVEVRELDLDSVEFVVEALSSREAGKAIAAMQLLANNNRARLIPALILYHDQPAVLIAALNLISTEERSDWIPLARRLLEHEDLEVRLAAMRALARRGIGDAAQIRLYDVQPEVRGHAAFLVEQRDQTADPQQHPAIQELLALRGAACERAKLGLLAAVRDAGDQRYAALILELSQDPSEEVSDAAVLTMTSLRDERFVPILIQRLGKRSGREAACDALVAQGARALEALRRTLVDDAVPTRIKRQLPGAIACFGNQFAANVLVERVTNEAIGLLRYKALKALGVLSQTSAVHVESDPLEQLLERELAEHLHMAATGELLAGAARGQTAQALSILLELLDEKASQALDRAFVLLQVLHRHEDIRSVAMAVKSPDRRIRARASEFVDSLTRGLARPRIRRLFSLIIDDLPLQEALKRGADDLGPLPSSATDALSRLLRSDDATLAMLAAYDALERRVMAVTPQVDALIAQSADTADSSALRDYRERVTS